MDSGLLRNSIMGKPLFSANEVVRLINGGPAMYVEGPGTGDGQVWCTWFNGRLYHGGSFDEKALICLCDEPSEGLPMAGAETLQAESTAQTLPHGACEDFNAAVTPKPLRPPMGRPQRAKK